MKRRRSRPIRIKADRWLRPKPVVITLARFREIEEGLACRSGYSYLVEDAENLQPPADAKEFAERVIFGISRNRCGGVTGHDLVWRCMRALKRGRSASGVYRHSGKTAAMDYVWKERRRLFKQWRHLSEAHDQVRYCGRLPFFGRLSRYEMARDLGANVVPPTRRLVRLSHLEGLSARNMCHRLAKRKGYREATIARFLEAAFAERLIDPDEIWCYGWDEGTAALELARRRLAIKAKYRASVAA